MEDHPERLKARELTQKEADALVDKVFKIEREIKKSCVTLHKVSWDLAHLLYEFDEEVGWKILGFDSLNEWLAQPEIGMPRRSYDEARKVWRDLCVTKQVPAKELEEVELSKVNEVLPAIMSGHVKTKDALADVKALGKRDLREKYDPDKVKQLGASTITTAPLDAEKEPERVKCPLCGEWTTEDKLPGKVE